MVRFQCQQVFPILPTVSVWARGCGCAWDVVRFQQMKSKIDPKLLQDPLFRALMAEGLAIQDRFSAEPVYARTGKGSLKSEGVAKLRKLKGQSKSVPKK